MDCGSQVLLGLGVVGLNVEHFFAASAGVVLGGRRRRRISMVLDTVIAAVPAAPAIRPLPMADVSRAGSGGR